MRDRTEELWFSGKKDSRTIITKRNRRNILASLIKVSDDHRTITADFLNNGKPSILHYIGNSRWVNEYTGYVHDWDGTHVCDRCGARLVKTFAAHNMEIAYFKDKYPRVAECGLCPNCGRDLEKEHPEDMHDSLVRREKGGLLLENKPNRVNDYAGWAFLDKRTVR